MKLYKVGGCVRDKILGVKTNDIDYVMVLDNINMTVEQGFDVMKTYMTNEGFEIFLETPEMFTIRAKFPDGHKHQGVADFVLARKEVGYKEGTRHPILELGTLEDDLVRRDFTVNAMAEDSDGTIIDLFGGMAALKNKILDTPTEPDKTFLDDPLRMLRGLRFSLTKGMKLSTEVKWAMHNPTTLKKLKEVVSQERVRDELFKMFKHDTLGTLVLLTEADGDYFPGLLEVCFGGDMWLEPTFKGKK